MIPNKCCCINFKITFIKSLLRVYYVPFAVLLLHFQLLNTVDYPMNKIDTRIFTLLFSCSENNQTNCDVMFLIMTLLAHLS
jgi:hypothetical protein